VTLGDVEPAGAVEGESVRQHEFVAVDRPRRERDRVAPFRVEPHDRAALGVDVVQHPVRSEHEREREPVTVGEPQLQ
jgi:hypothetical protein